MCSSDLIQLDYKAHDIKITPWEREINHIATGMSPQPRGGLLPFIMEKVEMR